MMKSAFGSKRKARKIQVDEDDEGSPNQTEELQPMSGSVSVAQHPTSIQKSYKQSSLRQSITFDDQDGHGGEESEASNKNQPTMGRSNSTRKKKKPPSSRLSFGPDEIISGYAAEALEEDGVFTPNKSAFGRRAGEGSALRKSLSYHNLPMRSNDDEDDRPTYSKDYLTELKNSTPITPKNIEAFSETSEEAEGLDTSELEGAMVVDTEAHLVVSRIPTEAEIREKKERRARLAHESDFISFSEPKSDNRISLLSQKKTETRLLREDEDLGEGFDAFVDDGRISLGKKQEREARKRHKKEMADMIRQAEGYSDEQSDDSEAERRVAYESAQTRAGMDSLHKQAEGAPSIQIPSKITPLPVLPECLEKLRNTLATMEQELARRQKQLRDAKQEKLEIGGREAEVQELLKQAGARYAALRADSSITVSRAETLDERRYDGGSSIMAERGLDSIGNTPIATANAKELG